VVVDKVGDCYGCATRYTLYVFRLERVLEARRRGEERRGEKRRRIGEAAIENDGY